MIPGRQLALVSPLVLLVDDDEPKPLKGRKRADRGPIIMSISPLAARASWSYRSPAESLELMMETRFPNRR